MPAKLTKITLHGDIGKKISKDVWNLSISSVREALHAINVLSNNELNNYFIRHNKLQAKYRVLINGRDFLCPVKELNETNMEEINNSELIMKHENLETIDIVPILEGTSNDVLGYIQIVVGVILMIASFFVPGLGPALFVAGLMLVGAGIMTLLTKPPKFDDFRKIDKAGKDSYLFSGPTNIVGEGGPIPVGYGTVLLGSQVISSSYRIQDYQIVREED